MENEFITVVPSEGFTVLNDRTFQKIPADGKRVRASAYWDRLIEEGAVKVKKEKDDKPKTEGAK